LAAPPGFYDPSFGSLAHSYAFGRRDFFIGRNHICRLWLWRPRSVMPSLGITRCSCYDPRLEGAIELPIPRETLRSLPLSSLRRFNVYRRWGQVFVFTGLRILFPRQTIGLAGEAGRRT